MEFGALAHPHHHRGERLIRNFGARVPRGNVLFGFPRATISFPPMQACQRRTIGGGGSGDGDGDRGRYARLRLHPPPLVSPCLLFVVPHYPTHSLRMGLIPFSVCRDCTARGRYWGAYRSARGCTTHSLPPLSIYPFPLPFAYLPFYRSYVRIPSVSAFPVPFGSSSSSPTLSLSLPHHPFSLDPSEYGEIRGARYGPGWPEKLCC